MATPKPPRPFTTPPRRRGNTLLETIHHPGFAAMSAAIVIGGLGMFLLSRLVSGPAQAPEPADALWREGMRLVLADAPAEARSAWEECLLRAPAREDCRAGLKLLDELAAAGSAARYPAPNLKRTASPPGMERAVRHFQNGDYEAAMKAAVDCMIAEPSDPACRSVFKLSKNRASAARPSAPRASADDKRQAASHWNVGILYFQRGEFAKARDEWELCLRIDPANADCATGVRRVERNYGANP